MSGGNKRGSEERNKAEEADRYTHTKRERGEGEREADVETMGRILILHKTSKVALLGLSELGQKDHILGWLI